MNSFGTILRLTTFGESHGPAMGGILDGMPSCVNIDFNEVRKIMSRRRPGTGAGVSTRREEDEVEFLSGFDENGLTLGTPIGFIIRNRDHRSGDYDCLKDIFRPNHADYTYLKKYGIREWRGGGRASARETVSRVAAGAVVVQWLSALGISIKAHATPGGDLGSAIASGDTIGGWVDCKITGIPFGLGEPVFDKFQARLASAMMGINAAHAFEYGDGAEMSTKRGSEVADTFRVGLPKDQPCLTNHSGGIQGGITNGMEVAFRVYFKPTPTIMLPIHTVNSKGEPVTLNLKGRHDVCVALRAVAIVEAMAALVTGDFLLISYARNYFE